MNGDFIDVQQTVVYAFEEEGKPQNIIVKDGGH